MKVLIANRGAIACRIARTARRMGLGTVAVYSEADVSSHHIDACDEAICLGAPAPKESYLATEKILEAAQRSGAVLIHPGYGFLSENAGFARDCEAAGRVFVGPSPEQMTAFGLKHRARELAAKSGVPLTPGSGLLGSVEEALSEARRIGYPVMLKSTAGGGGIGMRVCGSEEELQGDFDSVQRLGESNFSDGGVFLEKYIRRARHIEVQIFGDGEGKVLALGERDCSVQRRNQKVIEETPAPHLPETTRRELLESARRLGESVRYRSAGTVEYVLDDESGLFYFLEVNTRLQVEHGVTEEVLGVDLVEWMLRLACGEKDFLPEQAPEPKGHAIQVRVYAEDPHRKFQPSSGVLHGVSFPEGVRVETWVGRGTVVSPYYDPLLAKLICHEPDRAAALEAMGRALEQTEIHGIETNRGYLRELVREPLFVAGRMFTRFLDEFVYEAYGVDVLEPGAISTIQDYPGRLGYWDVGVPPSGPMDDASARLANVLLGNEPGAPVLELTMMGPSLKFRCAARVVLTGARMEIKLDGVKMEMDRVMEVAAGQVLKVGRATEAGVRSYLAVAGGWQVPKYLGSASTFTLGGFGGHAGRALKSGDVLSLKPLEESGVRAQEEMRVSAPTWTNHWHLRVMYGPHGAPDFFTEEDIRTFFATDWKVHYNSNPTGIRLIGPKPQWARSDGGEAGLHPSNIHDNAYAVGTVDYTGDMPILLGPDGPSLGGFVCPATVIAADRWMLGQLRPGDLLRFQAVGLTEAEEALRCMEKDLASASYPKSCGVRAQVELEALESPVVACQEAQADRVAVSYRCSGDQYLLVEYGPLVLDLDLRFRVQALLIWLSTNKPSGVLDLTPGIRSLQIHYDNRILPRKKLLELLQEAEKELPGLEDLELPSRIIHLPLSWDDPQTRLAIEKYMQSVRPDAPWCPSNLEFIRRINGLASIEEVKRCVFEASYLVLGLGDVYLGAPVATPLDPRHRLVTTKYNPARTWTPENAVGIGGAYLCIYGMEGPGGYQFVGRTVQVWNTHRQTADFKEGKPWLLRFFDQIRFYPVEAEELMVLREQFPLGRVSFQVEETQFKLKDYHAFLKREAAGISEFQTRQRRAFAEERERWAAQGQILAPMEAEVEMPEPEDTLPPEGCEFVRTPLTGNLWKVLVQVGDEVREGQAVAVVEAMKMETSIAAGSTGRVREIRVKEGRPVLAGQALVVLEEGGP
ncbi:MAG: urea carboxylase [Blastochloris sp.]|nr:urea carboxylase [Blastochloris sp.]